VTLWQLLRTFAERFKAAGKAASEHGRRFDDTAAELRRTAVRHWR
jgi:hypothetical protein